MLLSAVSVVVVVQSSSEIPEGLMNNSVFAMHGHVNVKPYIFCVSQLFCLTPAIPTELLIHL